MDIVGFIALALIVLFGMLSGAGVLLLGRFLEWLYKEDS
jgi:hypothetical protein